MQVALVRAQADEGLHLVKWHLPRPKIKSGLEVLDDEPRPGRRASRPRPMDARLARHLFHPVNLLGIQHGRETVANFEVSGAGHGMIKFFEQLLDAILVASKPSRKYRNADLASRIASPRSW